MLDTSYQVEIKLLNPQAGSDGEERARLQKVMNSLLENMEHVATKDQGGKSHV